VFHDDKLVDLGSRRLIGLRKTLEGEIKSAAAELSLEGGTWPSGRTRAQIVRERLGVERKRLHDQGLKGKDIVGELRRIRKDILQRIAPADPTSIDIAISATDEAPGRSP
jgi:hypothetical protein